MELVLNIQSSLKTSETFYPPHHWVIREESISTKLRVVFNGSAKSSNSVSLNEALYFGPKLQPDIFKILLNFRTFPIALSADIEKMYRQICVHSEDADFQGIIWRSDPKQPLSRLQTVTYGTSCAPYLAIRTLHQLAADEMTTSPEACKMNKKQSIEYQNSRGKNCGPKTLENIQKTRQTICFPILKISWKTCFRLWKFVIIARHRLGVLFVRILVSESHIDTLPNVQQYQV